MVKISNLNERVLNPITAFSQPKINLPGIYYLWVESDREDLNCSAVHEKETRLGYKLSLKTET